MQPACKNITEHTGFLLSISDVLLQQKPQLTVGVQKQKLEALLSYCLGLCITFIIFRTQQGSQQTITGRILKISSLNNCNE